ncbi:MAG: hypothetical protein NVV82_00350 [Sporocytophaga sp.]|nr:hypothetical protein [Sporocytophaga sp.]
MGPIIITEKVYWRKNLIEIDKVLFKQDHWRIRFENLYVGEIIHEDITHVKKLALKAYKNWKKQRENSGLKSISCEHDEIFLMLHLGSMAISRVKSIVSARYSNSSIDNQLKEEVDLNKLKQLDEEIYQFKMKLKRIYEQWGLEEADPERSELLYRQIVFKAKDF